MPSLSSATSTPAPSGIGLFSHLVQAVHAESAANTGLEDDSQELSNTQETQLSQPVSVGSIAQAEPGGPSTDHPPPITNSAPTSITPAVEGNSSLTRKRSSARIAKAVDPGPEPDDDVTSTAPSKSPSKGKKSTGRTTASAATLQAAVDDILSIREEVGTLRASTTDLGFVVGRLNRQADDHSAQVSELQDAVRTAQFSVKELTLGQRELQKMLDSRVPEPVQKLLDEVSVANARMDRTLVGEVGPVMEAYHNFMIEVRSRLGQLEEQAKADNLLPPAKRSRMDQPAPLLTFTHPNQGQCALPAPATAQAPAPDPTMVFHAPSQAPLRFTNPNAPPITTFVPPNLARNRRSYLIRLGPVDCNGSPPLFVIHSLIAGLPNGEMFSKLVKEARVDPGDPKFIIGSLWSRDMAAKVVNAWMTTRPESYRSISVEIIDQGN
ncbi:hypothetical protein BKA70DRAFT_1435460 [Coprinopsis sp. MPI-PUGE-AT-0042]|nr:hypothetical protein BKA70DRAFT_1435460 [Coprinopsis sp. MPI-PUGE-AT-0042]